MSAADDLGEFFDRIWKDTEGYVYLPVKGVNEFRKFMMPWPAKRESIINFVLKWAASETEEVFFSPAIFKSRKPLQKEVLGSWVAWVDFDGNFPETWPKDLAPVPSLEVQSSTSVKRHAYWELEEFTGPKEVEDINRALASALDADMPSRLTSRGGTPTSSFGPRTVSTANTRSPSSRRWCRAAPPGSTPCRRSMLCRAPKT